jgi:hypothetical protein
MTHCQRDLRNISEKKLTNIHKPVYASSWYCTETQHLCTNNFQHQFYLYFFNFYIIVKLYFETACYNRVGLGLVKFQPLLRQKL